MSRTINFSIDDGEVLIMRDKVNSANLKGSTIKVWLNNDTPYEFNYENREEAKEDFAKFKKDLNEYDEKSINEKLIEKACEWIKYNNENGGCLFDGWEEDFKKYMEK